MRRPRPPRSPPRDSKPYRDHDRPRRDHRDSHGVDKLAVVQPSDTRSDAAVSEWDDQTAAEHERTALAKNTAIWMLIVTAALTR